MKKLCFVFAFVLLLIPTLISAKTVTCTSNSKYYIGQDVYEHTSVECSEGSVEVFAVGKGTSTSYLVGGTDEAIAQQGVSYWMDVVWTGEIDSNNDTLLVDGDDQTDMSMGCDTGCHLITKTIASEPDPNASTGSGEEKEVAIGTIYYVGDRIKFNEISVILYTDFDDEYLEVDDGSYVIPSPQFVQDDGNGSWVWGFESFLKEYDESGLQGLYFGYTTNVSSDRVPIGIKCTGGNGSDVNYPYSFEPVYEDSNDPGNNDNPETVNYTILEGANQTYTLGSNETITIKASGDLDKLQAVEIDNGNPIDPSNYELADGSTVLTFKTSFLENSSVGEHEITFKYNDGEVSTKLTIANANSGNDNGNGNNGNNGNNSTTPSSNTSGNTTNNPQTADNVVFYILMLGLSVIALGSVGVYIKRRFFN